MSADVDQLQRKLTTRTFWKKICVLIKMRFFKILFIQKTILEHDGKQLFLITHFT